MDKFDFTKSGQLRVAMQTSSETLREVQRIVSDAHLAAMMSKDRGPSAAQIEALQAAAAEDHRATMAYFQYLDEMSRQCIDRHCTAQLSRLLKPSL